MSDNTDTAATSNDPVAKKADPDSAAPLFSDANTSSPVRLFGQFKPNGFGFNSPSPSNLSQLNSKDQTDDQNSSSGYFTTTLPKFSSASGFGSSSAPLAASLAPLGGSKPLFGGSSSTAPNSFTDLKASATSKTDDKEREATDEEEEEENEDEKSSLLENVAEYEAKRASTHPTVTIEGDTSTGEENEITKFEMAGKLFMYNPEQQQFVERGYGVLKINESRDPSDWDRLHARLIMRLDKSFRVILNSPVFAKMTVERATDRSVRFGAQDDTHLRVFVIKAAAIDCANLCKELRSRIDAIGRQPSTFSTPPKSLNTSASSDLVNLSDSSPNQNISGNRRKRSHSQSDSDVSDKANDLSKKTKTLEGSRRAKQSTSEDESGSTSKSHEQEPADR